MHPILQKITEQRRAIHFIESEIDELVKPLLQPIIPNYHRLFFTIGHWECKKSPIGTCVYNHMEDSALDNCLICGEPHERK